MIFLRQSYNVKPLRWGSPADIEYAVKVNAEKVYDVDPDSIVLCMPLFWGLPCLDYSGKRNDGVNHRVYYKDGKLEFNGTTSFVDCGNDSSLDITEVITIEVWIKKGTATGIDENIITKTTGASSVGGWAFTIKDDNKFVAFFADGNVPSPTFTTDSTIPINEVIHIVITNDGTTLSESIKVYFNSILQTGTEANYGTNSQSNSLHVKIGSLSQNVNHFNGSIAKICITNTIYTADQIALFHALPYGLYQPVIKRSYFLPVDFVPRITAFL